jgi:hypothetical protein
MRRRVAGWKRIPAIAIELFFIGWWGLIGWRSLHFISLLTPSLGQDQPTVPAPGPGLDVEAGVPWPRGVESGRPATWPAAAP